MFTRFLPFITAIGVALIVLFAGCGGGNANPIHPGDPFSDDPWLDPTDIPHWQADLQPDREQTEEVFWVEASDGLPIYTRIHRPVDSSATKQYPGLVLVPGGLQQGYAWHATWRKSNAWEFVDAGLIVLIYDARGRGWTAGEEDYDGPVQQDDLAQIIRWFVSRDDVLPGGVGVASSSWGITATSGAAARNPDLPIRFLIDLEGAQDRWVMTQWDDPKWVDIMEGHDTWETEFWDVREAISYIDDVTCPYFRIQSDCDHALDYFYVDHAIEMVNAAVNGKSPYVRLNDMEPNRLYDIDKAEEYHWFPIKDIDVTYYWAVLDAFEITTVVE
jgi:pimeloyl-ACP methyl ester carboxylesterase